MTDLKIQSPSLRPTTSDVGDDHYNHNQRDAMQTQSATASHCRSQRDAADRGRNGSRPGPNPGCAPATVVVISYQSRRLQQIPPDAPRQPLLAILFARMSRSGRRSLRSRDARGGPSRHRAFVRRRCRRRRREGRCAEDEGRMGDGRPVQPGGRRSGSGGEGGVGDFPALHQKSL